MAAMSAAAQDQLFPLWPTWIGQLRLPGADDYNPALVELSASGVAGNLFDGSHGAVAWLREWVGAAVGQWFEKMKVDKAPQWRLSGRLEALGMGQYREQETKPTEVLPIDASGSFGFVDGTKSYKDADELMQVLATDRQSHLCYSKKLASFGLQRDLVEADLPLLTKLAATSLSGTTSVKQVMIDLVQQDAFRVRSGGAQ